MLLLIILLVLLFGGGRGLLRLFQVGESRRPEDSRHGPGHRVDRLLARWGALISVESI